VRHIPTCAASRQAWAFGGHIDKYEGKSGAYLPSSYTYIMAGLIESFAKEHITTSHEIHE
jgi:hypothetical protein